MSADTTSAAADVADSTKTVAAYSDYLVDLAVASKGDVFLLVRCPICEEPLAEDLTRSEFGKVDDHIADHTPEELGLDGEIYEYRPFADILIEAYGLSPRADDDSEGVDFRHREPEFVVFDLDEAGVLDAVGVVDEEPYTPVAAEHRDLVEAIAERGGTITYAEAAEIYGRSTTYAARRLKQLHHAGWLQRVDNGRNGRHRYHLSDTEEEAVEQ